MVRTIAIGGFMGVGKTTAARALAERLHTNFVDLDEEISVNAGMSIRDIFAESGEDGFRRLETETLTSVLQRPPMVLSLGGGTLHQAANRERLESSLVVCLLMKFESVQKRIGADSASRPLWNQAASLYEYRLPLYLAQEHVLHVDELSESVVVDRLEELSRCA
tara:strand:+ start:513 stop:1004 length:492 start_codon:yes stop_codon:yes gene_type:complete